MHAVFIELPEFEGIREHYLNDDGFRQLQNALSKNPTAGVVIPGTGGVRKMRFVDERRRKGKRGGLRVIYYYWTGGPEFLLFTLYDKDEADDLSPAQRVGFRTRLKRQLEARRR